MDTMEKLRILTDAAKYDVACTSSGVDRAGVKGQLIIEKTGLLQRLKRLSPKMLRAG